VGVTVGGLRWLLSAVIADPLIFFAVQALHGVVVVGLNLGSPLYLDVVAPEKLRSTAQAILSMVGSGLAGILSNLTAGWLVDHGGTDLLYLLCGAGSLALGILSAWILPAVQRRDSEAKAVVLASETLT
jgi:MFS family permease